MSRPRWRLLCDDGASAAEGLALDEGLMSSFGRGQAPGADAALRLYTYRSHCALVGRYQHLAAEVDLDACARTGTQVNRRPTGGGAIIMGAGQLGVALATSAPAAARPRELLATFATGLVAALAGLGLAAQFRGKNDVEVGGRKIAGLGLYLDEQGALLLHASLLADLDVETMLTVLRIPAAKLPGGGAAAVAERVTTVSRELGRSVAPGEIRDAVAAGLADTVGAELLGDTPTPAEHRAMRAALQARYQRPEWLEEVTPAPDTTGSALLRTPAGLFRVYASVHAGVLKSLLFAGDATVVPRSLVGLEADLRWRRLDERSVRAAVRARPGLLEEVGAMETELVTAILAAGAGSTPPPTCAAPPPTSAAPLAGPAAPSARGAGRAVQEAAPLRPVGSCYFPEPGRSR